LDSKSNSRQFDSDRTHMSTIKPEIERKFILKKLPVFVYAETKWIWQFYVRESGEIVRYRETRHNNIKYEKIIKRNLGFGVNTEEVFEIDSNDFYNTNAKSNKLSEIHKKRHKFQYANLDYEIDLFDNIHLIYNGN
jgi:CYTH domain-containing protein